MLKKIVTLFSVLGLLFVVSCSTHIHTIGNGPQEFETLESRQWYILWGLVPLNEVNSAEMSGGAVDYEIKTEQSAVDVIISIFTSIVTVQARTVTVTK